MQCYKINWSSRKFASRKNYFGVNCDFEKKHLQPRQVRILRLMSLNRNKVIEFPNIKLYFYAASTEFLIIIFILK